MKLSQRQEQKTNVTKELDSTDDLVVADASDDTLKAEFGSFDRPKLEALLRPKDIDDNASAVPLEEIRDACLRCILSETTEPNTSITLRKFSTTKCT